MWPKDGVLVEIDSFLSRRNTQNLNFQNISSIRVDVEKATVCAFLFHLFFLFLFIEGKGGVI